MAIAPKPKPAAAAPVPAPPRVPLPNTKTVAATAVPAAAPTCATSAAPTIEVHRQFKNGARLVGEDSFTEKLAAATFLTQSGSISVKVGRTVSLGNYESVKIDVMVTMPCYVEELSDANTTTANMAFEFLQQHLSTAEAAFPRGEGMPTEGIPMDGGDEGTAEELSDTSEAAEAAADAGITVEEIMAMTRDQIIDIITTNQLPIDPAEYPDDDDLKAMLIHEAGLGDPDAEAAAEEASADGEPAAYAEDELKAMDPAGLKEIYVAWEMGDYPKGPPAVAKKKAVEAILKLQNGA